MGKNVGTAYFLYACIVLIWSTTWFAVPLQTCHMSIQHALTWRFLVAGVLVHFLFPKVHNPRLLLAEHGWLALQGFFIYFLQCICLYQATNYLPSGLIALVGSTVLYFNIGIQRLLYRTPLTHSVAIGCACVSLGMFLFFLFMPFASIGFTPLLKGLCITFGANIAAALGHLALQRNLSFHPPLIVARYSFQYGALLYLFCAFFLEGPLPLPLSLSFFAATAYLAIGGSIVAFLAFITLTKQLGTNKISFVFALYPMLALLFSSWLENLPWDSRQLIGLTIVLIGNTIALSNCLERSSPFSTRITQFVRKYVPFLS